MSWAAENLNKILDPDFALYFGSQNNVPSISVGFIGIFVFGGGPGWKPRQFDGDLVFIFRRYAQSIVCVPRLWSLVMEKTVELSLYFGLWGSLSR